MKNEIIRLFFAHTFVVVKKSPTLLKVENLLSSFVIVEEKEILEINIEQMQKKCFFLGLLLPYCCPAQALAFKAVFEVGFFFSHLLAATLKFQLWFFTLAAVAQAMMLTDPFIRCVALVDAGWIFSIRTSTAHPKDKDPRAAATSRPTPRREKSRLCQHYTTTAFGLQV